MQARITERVDFNEELAVFRMEPEEQLDFIPGQYATLALPSNVGRPTLRPYSIVSAPHEPFLEFFVELVEDGELTTRLWSMTQGATIWVRKRAVGHFVLDKGGDRHRHVMAATVTGIAPFLSMIRAQRHELATGSPDSPHPFLVIHGASRSWEMGSYLDELREASREEWLTYIPTVSRPWEDRDWSGEVGRCEDILRKYMDARGFTASNAIGYACGHPQMIENAKGIFRRTGMAPRYIHEEKYFQETEASKKTPSKQKRGPSPESITLRSVPPPSGKTSQDGSNS